MVMNEVELSRRAPAPTPDLDPDNMIAARAVARRFGISTRTLDRWMLAEQIKFPPPDLVTRDSIGRPANRFWRNGTVLEWESNNCRPKLGRPAKAESEAA